MKKFLNSSIAFFAVLIFVIAAFSFSTPKETVKVPESSNLKFTPFGPGPGIPITVKAGSDIYDSSGTLMHSCGDLFWVFVDNSSVIINTGSTIYSDSYLTRPFYAGIITAISGPTMNQSFFVSYSIPAYPLTGLIGGNAIPC